MLALCLTLPCAACGGQKTPAPASTPAETPTLTETPAPTETPEPVSYEDGLFAMDYGGFSRLTVLSDCIRKTFRASVCFFPQILLK